MIDIGVVYGDKLSAIDIVIDETTVYVHSGIEQCLDIDGNAVDNLYQYNEIQYEKDEYIKIMSEKNSEVQAQLIETQKALCDIYEAIS